MSDRNNAKNIHRLFGRQAYFHYLCGRLMRSFSFNKCEPLRFKHFSRKGYSLFVALGREVIVGVLSISTLTYAKADSISIRPVLAGDTLKHQEVKLEEVVVTGSRAPLTAQQLARMLPPPPYKVLTTY